MAFGRLGGIGSLGSIGGFGQEDQGDPFNRRRRGSLANQPTPGARTTGPITPYDPLASTVGFPAIQGQRAEPPTQQPPRTVSPTEWGQTAGPREDEYSRVTAPTGGPTGILTERDIGPQASDTVPEDRSGKIPQPFLGEYPEQGTAMQAFKAHVEAMPSMGDYEGGFWSKLGAGLVGASTGWEQGGAEGYKAAREMRYDPYNVAMQQWQAQGSGLAQLADIETKEREAQAAHMLASRELYSEEQKQQVDIDNIRSQMAERSVDMNLTLSGWKKFGVDGNGFPLLVQESTGAVRRVDVPGLVTNAEHHANTIGADNYFRLSVTQDLGEARIKILKQRNDIVRWNARQRSILSGEMTVAEQVRDHAFNINDSLENATTFSGMTFDEAQLKDQQRGSNIYTSMFHQGTNGNIINMAERYTQLDEKGNVHLNDPSRDSNGEIMDNPEGFWDSDEEMRLWADEREGFQVFTHMMGLGNNTYADALTGQSTKTPMQTLIDENSGASLSERQAQGVGPLERVTPQSLGMEPFMVGGEVVVGNSLPYYEKHLRRMRGEEEPASAPSPTEYDMIDDDEMNQILTEGLTVEPVGGQRGPSGRGGGFDDIEPTTATQPTATQPTGITPTAEPYPGLGMQPFQGQSQAQIPQQGISGPPGTGPGMRFGSQGEPIPSRGVTAGTPGAGPQGEQLQEVQWAQSFTPPTDTDLRQRVENISPQEKEAITDLRKELDRLGVEDIPAGYRQEDIENTFLKIRDAVTYDPNNPDAWFKTQVPGLASAIGSLGGLVSAFKGAAEEAAILGGQAASYTLEGADDIRRKIMGGGKAPVMPTTESYLQKSGFYNDLLQAINPASSLPERFGGGTGMPDLGSPGRDNISDINLAPETSSAAEGRTAGRTGPSTFVLADSDVSRTIDKSGLSNSIITTSQKWDVDPAILSALFMRESSMRPGIRGDRGTSYGLGQLKLSTARAYMPDVTKEDLKDPEINMDISSRHLKAMMDKYGDITYALAAYNAGEPAADRWKKGGSGWYPMTRKYVDEILAMAKETGYQVEGPRAFEGVRSFTNGR